MESLLKSRNRWVTLGLAAASVVALLVATDWQRARAAQSQTAAPPGTRGLGSVLDELTLALQGEPIAVKASPVLCYSGTAPPPSAADPVQWYFCVEGCERTYAPRQGALVTPASEDLSKDYFAEKRTQDQVTGLLRELAILVRAAIGQTAEAEEAFLGVRRGFIELGFGYEAGLVSLDLAVLYASEGRFIGLDAQLGPSDSAPSVSS